MEWGNKTVLVTGAGGFVGGHLVERLVEAGAHTRALVHYNSTHSRGWLDRSPHKNSMEIIAGDICDEESVHRAVKGVDIIFHLAALIAIPYSYENPRAYVRTNIEGTLNVLQAALNEKTGLVVHTSSSEVYGTARYTPMDESHPLQAQSPYAASKIGADKLAESFYRSFDLPVAIIRPFNTYGPRQSMRAVIPTIIAQALTRPEIKLGNLAPVRDFNYVADSVSAYLSMAECPEAVGQTVNIGRGEGISIRDLANTIIGLIGSEARLAQDPHRLRPKESEVDCLCADNRKAQELLGWRPQYSLEQGLQTVIDWVKENLDQYQADAYVK